MCLKALSHETKSNLEKNNGHCKEIDVYFLIISFKKLLSLLSFKCQTF